MTARVFVTAVDSVVIRDNADRVSLVLTADEADHLAAQLHRAADRSRALYQPPRKERPV